jgi:hypothetical protein
LAESILPECALLSVESGEQCADDVGKHPGIILPRYGLPVGVAHYPGGQRWLELDRGYSESRYCGCNSLRGWRL